MTAGLRERDGVTTHQTAVLACICVCTVLVTGFVASINLAVPKLAASTLHPSASQLLWIVDAYVIIFACLVIPAGALGDRIGRKGVLLSGLLIFAAGAVVSASAADVAVMLVGRAVTGLGAACVLPNALAVLIHATAPERRPHAIAVWASASGIGGVVGNLGGGAILTAGSWRWLFAAVAPIAALCALWVALGTPRSSRHDRSLRVTAVLLLTAATFALLIGITQGPENGWGSALVVGSFVSSAVLSAAWVSTELKAEHPLLDPHLFTIPALRAASLGMLIVFFGMFGFFYLNASLLQYGRGFSVLQTGLAIMPMTLPLVVGTRYIPGLVKRFGGRTVIGVAFLLISIGLYGLALGLHQSYLVYAVWLVVIGIGVTLALPTLTAEISGALPREQAGVAGGLQSTTRELGSALGVAVIGTILTSQFAHHLDRGVGTDPAAHTVAEALAAAPMRHDTVIAAYVSGAETALKIVAALVLVVGALIVTEMTWSTRCFERIRNAGAEGQRNR
ncbi:MFS transporter [Tsukamurella sp. 8F]|uniref:MFS transporter n=1 Tax=unclassified Tsukamurella TaxID=2633480 RepID=UPI0023B9CD49|nr:MULTISPECIES: MFS transporter [unclassified Tsukamurella]MDF0530210.1 MFS transporter [Tsukamurella sp. 8J]MDF0586527.1 MFS transporter [Tsukamurella sp. 8F]